MGEVVTKTEYARSKGVTPAAVTAWLARGHLTSPALRADGRIDVEMADGQLRERLDHARRATDVDRPPPADAASPPPAAAALIERQRQQRIEENDLKLRRLRREELERAGHLVDADAMARAHGRSFEELMTAIEQWQLGDLAPQLGLSREQIEVVRREWRAFRARQAAAALRQAGALAEHVEMEITA
jgi:hypothetical protein